MSNLFSDAAQKKQELQNDLKLKMLLHKKTKNQIDVSKLKKISKRDITRLSLCIQAKNYVKLKGYAARNFTTMNAVVDYLIEHFCF